MPTPATPIRPVLQLKLKNFAIIESATLNLGIQKSPSFTAITGETGSGKSLIIQALGLIQGKRADKSYIKSGHSNATISAHLTLAKDSEAFQYLKSNNLLSDDKNEQTICQIDRIISPSGRSKIVINQHASNLQQLRTLGPLLLRIHGQHQYHELISPEKQLSILDQFGTLKASVNSTENAYRLWQQAEEALKQLRQIATTAEQRKTLLSYQVTELAQLELTPEKIQSYYARHKKLCVATEQRIVLAELFNLVQDSPNHSIISSLEQALHILKHSGLSSLPKNQQTLDSTTLPSSPSSTKTSSNPNEQFTHIHHLLHDSLNLLQECQLCLQHTSDGLENDTESLEEIEKFISTLNQLSRKHKVPAMELPILAKQLTQEYQQLNDIDETLKEQQQITYSAFEQYWQSALTLSKQRHKQAEKLGKALSTYCRQLGMVDAHCKILLTRSEKPVLTAAPFEVETDHDATNNDEMAATEIESVKTQPISQKLSPQGIDHIDFLFSNHADSPPSPLRKTASGGELSRLSMGMFMLASQDTDCILVFDEVDSGIGGRIGELLGSHIKAISQKNPVVCVTHLPQIAAKSSQHITVQQIKKTMKAKSTCQTVIKTVKAEDQSAEFARMFGLNPLSTPLIQASTEQWREG